MDNKHPDDDYFVIEPDRLVEQWCTFARDYFHRAKALVEAKEEFERTKRVRDVMVAEKKDALELVEARLDHKVRADPQLYGIEKLTEAVVSNTIKMQEEYQQARSELYKTSFSCEEEIAKARHAMGIHQAYVNAMDAMKKGLESTTYLWQNNYHAEPRVRGDAGRNMADAKIDKALGSRKHRVDD